MDGFIGGNMEMLTSSIIALLATLGFCIVFNIRGKNLFYSSIGGGISWFFYSLANNLWGSSILSLFIGALVGSIYAEIMARVRKTPVTLFVICSIIPLVPGSDMYYAMYQSISGNIDKSITTSVVTMSKALSIAFAIILVSSMAKLSKEMKLKKERIIKKI